jgi:RimJ/RimL family protein N-acetyltransferase
MELLETVAAEGRWLGSEAPIDRTEALLTHWRRQLSGDDEAGAVLLAQRPDGGMAGWIGLEAARGRRVDFGMAVAGADRGRGLGGGLLDAGVTWAHGSGSAKVSCQVWPHNTPALRLYLSRGFEIEGRLRRHWPRANGERWDTVVLGLLLDHRSPSSPHPDSPLLAGTVAESRSR